jgi:hypothetical protein
MTPATYLESLGYEIEETRGNLFHVTFDDGIHMTNYRCDESQLEAFARDRGWTPEGEKP